jgi:hypothetical protein
MQRRCGGGSSACRSVQILSAENRYKHNAARAMKWQRSAGPARFVCAAWSACLLACVSALGTPTACAAAAAADLPAAPPPLRINLDAFEAMKKQVALPNSETLAYLEMGSTDGPPVVLIHGTPTAHATGCRWSLISRRPFA